MKGVPFSDRHISCEGGCCLLDHQLYDWLIENIGKGSRDGGWSTDCHWLWTWQKDLPRHAVLVFDDVDSAILFKLTWGGS